MHMSHAHAHPGAGARAVQHMHVHIYICTLRRWSTSCARRARWAISPTSSAARPRRCRPEQHAHAPCTMHHAPCTMLMPHVHVHLHAFVNMGNSVHMHATCTCASHANICEHGRVYRPCCSHAHDMCMRAGDRSGRGSRRGRHGSREPIRRTVWYLECGRRRRQRRGGRARA